MSTESKSRDSLWADDLPPALSWRSWPAREHWGHALFVLAGLAGAGVGVGWLTGRVYLALIAAGVVFLALWRFFWPVVFGLGPDGVDQWLLLWKRHRRIPWTAIRRYEVHANGVLLLPFADYRPMDAARGLYLPWGKRREEVLFQIRFYVDQSN